MARTVESMDNKYKKIGKELDNKLVCLWVSLHFKYKKKARRKNNVARDEYLWTIYETAWVWIGWQTKRTAIRKAASLL
jgi:hypothetical protein